MDKCRVASVMLDDDADCFIGAVGEIHECGVVLGGGAKQGAESFEVRTCVVANGGSGRGRHRRFEFDGVDARVSMVGGLSRLAIVCRATR